MDIQGIEKRILRFWQENKIFEKSIKNRAGARDFVFYEGPPTANGKPGIHHVLIRSFKDVICRYKTMRGFRVERKAGWDTHGLPVEIEVENQLGLKNKKDIEKYGIAKFNKKCRESVWRYIEDWEDLTKKIGFWLDMDNPYITYERSYMETLWRIIKRVWEQGLLYQDFKVVPYCARCGTGLSSHEVALGYKKIKEPSIYVKFKINNRNFKNTSFLVWTTTPWTLPGNVAIAAHPDIEYVEIKTAKENLILAKARLAAINGTYKIMRELRGSDLCGLEYHPLFSFGKTGGGAFRVIEGDFVSVEEGTGFVHIAPAFGEEDMEAVKAHNAKRKAQSEQIPVVLSVKEDGTFTDEVKPWAGMWVKDADPLIIKDLASKQILYREASYEHDYPFCWRCDSPLLYFAKKSWFIRMSKLKNRLIRENKTIQWIPSHLQEGRFGEWLRELKDWAFSRERYWGTPLPLWQCEGCAAYEAIGSVADFMDKSYTTNTFFILRHGEARSNVGNFVSSWPEQKTNPLTKKGEHSIKRAALTLKREGIDLILASPLKRTRDSARLIGKILHVPVQEIRGLREMDTGFLNGGSIRGFRKFFGSDAREFTKRPAGGENLTDVRMRMVAAIRKIDKKYQNKRILLVSHEYPLWMLDGGMRGMSNEESVKSKKRMCLDPGEWKKIPYTHLPYNEEGELDLHRPFVDEVTFFCAFCKKGKMKRVSEVVDVWFDSGAMPFAQGHWPLAQKEKGKMKTLPPPEVFPADFICEGMDQTRGWFYTLLAISMLLGFGSPYRSVISLGLVLDKKGEKMSKSLGNAVDPWQMISRYGADATRWYFYTVNQPGEVKKFDEADIQERQRGFIGTFYNTLLFLKTYSFLSNPNPSTLYPRPKRGSPKAAKRSAHVLDTWIISRFNEAVRDVTLMLDAYDIVSASRILEVFVDDLSNWYVRRSRRRFQRPRNEKEKIEARGTLGYIMGELAKIAAPLTPFLSEEIYQNVVKLSGRKAGEEQSVHLHDWPSFKKAHIDEELNQKMDTVRRIVSLGLKARAKSHIKVRQPLARMEVQMNSRRLGALTDLIREELNVKELEFVDTINKNFIKEGAGDFLVALDTEITPQLEEEGRVREITRIIQDMRKEAGYEPHWPAELSLTAQDHLRGILKRWKGFIKYETNTRAIVFASRAKTFDIEKDISMYGDILTIRMRKI